MFKRIVVGWNGTDASERALEWALQRGNEVPIIVVHVVERSASGFDEERVEAVLDRQTPARRWDVETRITEGDPEEVFAAELRPDTLLVLGTPAHQRGSRWSLGARLAGRHGGGTVAVIPSAPRDDVGLPVVAGVDGSLASLRAVDVAVGEALHRHVEVEIFHAWRPPSTWAPVFGEVSADLEVFESMHRRTLDDALARTRHSAAKVTGYLRRADAFQLLAEAGDEASLLVVASHGYGPLRRFFLGSVSVMLLMDPPCPVLVVTEERADEPEPESKR
ncbi:universal stress protein [Agromyces soli]|uniref:Universal stress protein n=1 Tax=Agromyces soli TaxID=659012 RepID=A0ABY4AUF0_9MICO|nr:universal stress protein [Agromyces soli]UOE26801.1 universal stress protein [Agromyces soli]